MSAGFVVTDVWSMSSGLKDTSTIDDSLTTKSVNDPLATESVDDSTFRVIMVDVDDPKKQQVYTCSLCGKSYNWPCSLRRHQLQCGNKEARNKCKICAKGFFRRDRFKEHLLSHHSNSCESWITEILSEWK